MTEHSSALVIRVLAASALMATFAVAAPAQSLGELAKREEARRQAAKAPAKVYTNDTVGSTPAPPAPPSSPAPPAAAPSASAAKVPATAPADDKAKQADPKKDEAAWRQRIQGARDSLQRSEIFAEALQSRINALTADFTARDDPAQRAVVANDRQKALAELDRVKNDIAQQTKAIATIQEEARRAGVPPGWLR
jgi:HAMP domain-containing protein